jgi:hypothetical protein
MTVGFADWWANLLSVLEGWMPLTPNAKSVSEKDLGNISQYETQYRDQLM